MLVRFINDNWIIIPFVVGFILLVIGMIKIQSSSIRSCMPFFMTGIFLVIFPLLIDTIYSFEAESSKQIKQQVEMLHNEISELQKKISPVENKTEKKEASL